MVAETRKRTKDESDSGSAKKAKKKSSSEYDCDITCLDGSKLNFSVDKSSKGEVLFGKIMEDLSIAEKEYMGLLFADEKGVKIWLDIHKDMKHQLKDLKPKFELRVKFYEPEPTRLQDEYMRYLLYLQLREDIVSGSLVCSNNTYITLGAYTAQAELGDFHLSEHDHNYLDDYDFAPTKSAAMNKSIHDMHKQHRGQTPAQAELNFLEVAKKIHLYGVDIHHAHDGDGPVDIGMSALGINSYRNDEREYLFKWQLVDVILYNRRKFTVKLKEPVNDEENEKNKSKPKLTYIYYLNSAKECKQCYKSAVEYHTFFRLTRPDAPRKKADKLKLGSSFRYSDRTLYQLRHKPSFNDSNVSDASFNRTPSKRKSKPEPKGIIEEESPVQYEEIAIDESNPDDDKYDPKEWEIIEKKLPDGTKKRFRRRIIIVKLKPKHTDDVPMVEESPVQFEEVEIDEENPDDDKFDPEEWDIVEKTLPDGTKKRFRQRRLGGNIPMVEEGPVHYQEKEMVEKDSEDGTYNPLEWAIIEKKLPDGKKKKFQRRIITVTKKGEDDPMVNEVPIPYEEVDVDESRPDDKRFDPEVWETIEKRSPDGTRKKVHRKKIDIVSVVARKPLRDEDKADCPVTVVESPFDYKEKEIDKTNPEDDDFDPETFEVVEKPQPDGTKKRYRRRILVLTVPKLTDDKKDVESEDGIVPMIEEMPVRYEEIDIDHADSDGADDDDEKFNPQEWDIVEKIDPDGNKKKLRRRIIVVTTLKKRNENDECVPMVVHESPIQCDEVEIDESNPEHDKYDPKEWDIVEKIYPGGTIKRYRQRRLGRNIPIVEEGPVYYQEKEIVEKDSEDRTYNPLEWAIIEKKLPDGKKKKFQRRIITVTKKGEDDPMVNEVPIPYEEVDVDESRPDDKRFDPEVWETIEKRSPDGTRKKVHRKKMDIVSVVARKPLRDEDKADCPVTVVESPLDYEEKEIDKTNPEDDDFDPETFEVVEKPQPDGTKKRYRRRILVLTVPKLTDDKKDVENEDGIVPMIEEMPVRYEEIDIDHADSDGADDDDEKFNPQEWDIVEKIDPDGNKKKLRRRIIVVTTLKKRYENDECVPIVVDESQIQCDEVEIDESNPEHDKYDPKDWEIVEKILPDGTKKRYRKRIIVISIVKKPNQVSPIVDEAPIQYEEVEIDESNPEDDKYDPKDWEVVEKTLPNGKKKRVRRRIIVISLAKKDKPNNGIGVPVDEAPVQYEEVDIDESNPEDDKYDPKDWEIVEKTSSDGTKKRVRRRVVIVLVVSGKKDLPLAEEKPIVYEEREFDEELQNDDSFNPEEWETIEKCSPDGKKKKFVRRLVIVTPVKNNDDEPMHDESLIPFEEIEIDESSPEDEKYDPEEWEVVEQTLPDGGKKRVKRKKITLIKVIAIKPVTDNIKEDSIVAPVMVVEKPFKEEEVEINEANPRDENFDPKEWEVVEKPQPDGTKKRYRRRILFLTVPKLTDDKKDVESKDGIVPMIEEMPVRYEEIDIDHAHPDFEDDEKFYPQDWDIVEKTLPDGTQKILRRRVITVATIKKRKGKGDDIMPIVSETPIQFEEVEVDESNPDNNRYDPIEWEVIQRRRPNGVRIRVRRRIATITIVSRPNKDVVTPVVDESPIHYEEVELDESNPEDDKYDPKDWEIVEKTLPDGTKKRYRRRIIVISIVKKPNQVFPIVDEAPIQYEEVEIDESNPEDDKYDPKDWEIVEKELPDGTKKRYRRRVITTITTTYLVHPDGSEEEVSMETKPIVTVVVKPTGTSERMTDEYVIVPNQISTTESALEEIDGEVQLPVLDVNMDDILTEINAMSLSLDDPQVKMEKVDKPKKNNGLNQRKDKLDEKMKKVQLENNEDTEEERIERNEALRKRSEEEKRLGEDLNATLDSIFKLPEEELLGRPQRSRISFHEMSFEIPEDHMKIESDDDLEYVSVEDAEYIGIDTEEMIRTASLLRQKKDEERRTSEKPKPAKRSATVPNQRESTSNLTPRKLSGGAKPRPLSNVGLDQSNYRLPHQHGSSHIIYTVTDVSNVEQGAGGFVRAVKAKHEGIASDEEKSVRRSSRLLSDHELHTPKGHVPTRTVSFDENDKAKVIRTKAPPAVATKPTVIVPATSELPDEEVFLEVNQLPEESHPDIESEIIDPTDLPQVETQSVIFEPTDDDVKIIPVGSEPGVVETQTVHIVPQTESEVVETIHVLPPDVNTHETDSHCTVTTHTLPTEVITKTITIEGDTSSMTPEELQKLIDEAGGDDSIDSSTYTQVVRTTTVQKVITGQTITVTGDHNGEEMSRDVQLDDKETLSAMIRNAVAAANENVGDDKTIVLTAVQTFEEDVEEDENGDTEI